jgi:hypothetical protein
MDLVEGVEPCPSKLITDATRKSVSNPEYLNWNKNDQYLLSLITSSLFEKVIATVYGLNTSHQVWTALATKFASKSKSWISHLKKQLHNLSQGPKSCSNYMQATKTLADQIGAAGNPIFNDELIS